MASKTSKAVLVRVPAELHAAVKVKASSEERSMAEAILYALRRYLEDGEASGDERAVRPYTTGAAFRG